MLKTSDVLRAGKQQRVIDNREESKELGHMKVVFVDHAGQRNVVETQGKLSVMELATANGISEIVAECRGSCSWRHMSRFRR